MQKDSKRSIRYNKIILIPTDFSEVCENAIQHGIQLAHYLNYKVCILHVINSRKDPSQKTVMTDPEQIRKELVKYKNRYEKGLNVPIDLIIEEGKILNVINRVAARIKANLMILGTHGKQGLQHLFGSHALKVVLDAPCPVLVVQKRSFHKGYRSIVLPFSSDIEPCQSMGWILLMCRLFKSKILLFHSLEQDESLNKSLQAIIRDISGIFNEKKIPYEIHSAETAGDFSSQVISYAVKNKSDMIIIMTMPGIEVPGFNFSAWNEKLMFNEAQIPVMCVNPLELGDNLSEWIK